MEKNIVIYGTGKIARRTFYKHQNEKCIVNWYDDGTEEIELYGIPIRQEIKKSKDQIIIVSDADWIEKSNKLSKMGYVMCSDYFPFWVLEYDLVSWKNIFSLGMENAQRIIEYLAKKKKICVVYGNCQTELIQRFLLENSDFLREYLIIDIPRVCQETKNTWEMIRNSCLFSTCNLFIYQHVNKNNKYGLERSSDELIEQLNDDCQKISIPNIYFDGYFPQLVKNEYNILQDVQEDGLFKWGDKYFNSLINEGKDFETALKIIKQVDFLSENEIKKKVCESFENLELKEKTTDIKISDYIKKYYKTRQLFFAPNHPINEVLIECTKRIIRKLGFDEECKYTSVDQFYSLMGEDIPIYSSVIKTLNIEKYYDSFYPNRYIEKKSVSMDKYYEMYFKIVKIQSQK